MNRLRIEFDGDRASFLPGEQVAGTVSWQLLEPTESVELRLFYYTLGKGDQDVGVAEAKELPAVQEGEERFELTLPRQPYSFSGTLISIVWALELVANPGAITERLEIVIGPEKREVRVSSVDPDKSAAGAGSGEASG